LRVLLADDHALVRAGIRALVAVLPNVTEVMEASDGQEAVAAVSRHHPDVVLMDITMPRLSGLEATSRIIKESPGTRVIILSVHHSEEFVRQAFRAGAHGYLIKSGAAAELQAALRAVEHGQTYISPSLGRQLPEELRDAGGDFVPIERLTARQREILQLIAEGFTSPQIASKLQIHVKTVDSHRTQLMKRLGIHEIAGLVRYAIRIGLVPIE
jgi:DNA-binding NarL/FixJ family response regulator